MGWVPLYTVVGKAIVPHTAVEIFTSYIINIGWRRYAVRSLYIIPTYRCRPSGGDMRKKGFRVIYESNTTFTHRLYIQIYYGIRDVKFAGRNSLF